jgi:hypothetical protein
MARRAQHIVTDQMLREEHFVLHRQLRKVDDGGMNSSAGDMEIMLLRGRIANLEARMKRHGIPIPGPYHPSELDGVDPK